VLDADARRARRASRAARVLHPVTPGQPHGAGVRLEPQPSVVRSVPARLRSSRRQFSAASSARTRPEIVDCVTPSRSAVG
jgi:hypothetical protein